MRSRLGRQGILQRLGVVKQAARHKRRSAPPGTRLICCEQFLTFDDALLFTDHQLTLGYSASLLVRDKGIIEVHVYSKPATR